MGKLDGTISREALAAVLGYCAETGIFTWRQPMGTRNRPGMTAGSVNDGYTVIRIYGERYFAHRLVFLYMTGEWPSQVVDHRDGNRTNNSWANLRQATVAENSQNRAIGATNRSGFLGVGWNKGKQKWHARIKIAGHLTHLGYFDDINLAASAYAAEKSKIHTFNPAVRA